MLDRSQYQQYQSQYVPPAVASVPSVRSQNYSSLFSYAPTEGYNFQARQPNVSAGVGDWTHSLEGFGRGTMLEGLTDSLAGLGRGIKDYIPSGFLSSTDDKGMKKDGWGNTALGVANGLFNGYMGMKNYGLAKDTFDFNKSMGLANFNNQATLVQDRRQGLYDRDVASAKLNGTAMPRELTPLQRMG